MNKKNELLIKVNELTEEERLQLFNVEELESRLEMAAVAVAATNNNSGCQGKPGDSNSGCTSNSSCGW